MEMLMKMSQFEESSVLSETQSINITKYDDPTLFHNPVLDSSSSVSNMFNPFEYPNSKDKMREMVFKIGAMQPIQIDPESVKAPKRRNVKISKDPQSVAARERRGRISEKIRILQRLVPGGMKMDTATMLDEAICYVQFLKEQIHLLENGDGGFPVAFKFPAAVTGDWNHSC